jgi:hypothetical protein
MKKIWILVKTYRGIIDEPEVFFDEKSALRRLNRLRKTLNPDYDEADVFEKVLRLH